MSAKSGASTPNREFGLPANLIVVVLVVLTGIAGFRLISETSLMQRLVFESVSRDGGHRLVVHDRGTAGLFGPATIRIRVYEVNQDSSWLSSDRELHQFETRVANDGAAIGEENFFVSWQPNAVSLTLTGDEQTPLTCAFYFDGTRECERHFPAPPQETPTPSDTTTSPQASDITEPSESTGLAETASPRDPSPPEIPVAEDRQMPPNLRENPEVGWQVPAMEAIVADAELLGIEVGAPVFDMNARADLFVRVNEGTSADGVPFQDRLFHKKTTQQDGQELYLIRVYTGEQGNTIFDEPLGEFRYDPATGETSRID